MLSKKVSLNGKLVDAAQAAIPIDNIHFTYGFGVYENLKVRKGVLYFPERHIDRLFMSAKTIGLPIGFSSDEIKDFLERFVKSVDEKSFNIKVLCVGAGSEKSDLYIFANAPKYISKKLYRDGVSVITHVGERDFPQAKTLNMLLSYVVYSKAKEQGCYDALLVGHDGEILEGTRTNLFFTDGKTIFTSPKDLVLEGVTRMTLIEALSQKGIKVEEKVLTQKDLFSYKGFFLTSTSTKVVPVSLIDGQPVEIPEIVRDVISIYDEYLEEYVREL